MAAARFSASLPASIFAERETGVALFSLIEISVVTAHGSFTPYDCPLTLSQIWGQPFDSCDDLA